MKASKSIIPIQLLFDLKFAASISNDAIKKY
ncbi:hypothetical protein GILI108418_06380 [Gillisia limnaea]|uniref:Uncharacterized protein n=1 Tax=Gillisia limnaea (strain DSM 15749 / LMG 21470 / R-8282) TaxID=865937 RepID=H2BSU1_GILLR|nr:hypothetical protein Gilli_0769 [Gillisia limnaea DSM 15749]